MPVTATVATRPPARRPAVIPPAKSICDINQPPKGMKALTLDTELQTTGKPATLWGHPGGKGLKGGKARLDGRAITKDDLLGKTYQYYYRGYLVSGGMSGGAAITPNGVCGIIVAVDPHNRISIIVPSDYLATLWKHRESFKELQQDLRKHRI